MPIDTGYGWIIPGCPIEFATEQEALEWIAEHSE